MEQQRIKQVQQCWCALPLSPSLPFPHSWACAHRSRPCAGEQADMDGLGAFASAFFAFCAAETDFWDFRRMSPLTGQVTSWHVCPCSPPFPFVTLHSFFPPLRGFMVGLFRLFLSH